MSTHLDFVFFCHGFAYILMAAVCLSLHSASRRILPWTLLAAFSACLGIVAWLNLVALTTGDSRTLYLLRLGLMTLAFGFLIEFARSGNLRLGGRPLGKWIYVLLLSVVALAAFVSDEALKAAPRFTFALAGSIYAAGVFFRASRQEQAGRRSLRAAGVAMVALAVSSGLLGPSADFIPASILNQENFQRLAGIPIQAVRSALAVVIVIVLSSYYYAVHRASAADEERTLATPFSPVLIPALLLILGLGWLGTARTGLHTEKVLLDRACTRARLMGVAVESAVPTLERTDSSHLAASSIERLRQEFRNMRAVDAEATGYQLLCVTTDGVAVLASDALSHADSQRRDAAVAFVQAKASEIPLLDPGTTLVAPASDKGYRRVAVVLRGGLVSGDHHVLVVHLATGHWQRMVHAVRLFPLAITLILAVSVIALDLARLRDRRSTARTAASEKRYRSLFDESLAGNYVTSLDGRILLCNQAFAQLLGYTSVAQVMRTGATSFYEDPHKREDFLTRLRERKVLLQHESTLIRRDGHPVSVIENVKGVFNEEDELVRLEGNLIDITERKRVEDALRQSEARVREVVDKSTDAIGVRLGRRLVLVNPKFEHLTGHPASELTSPEFDFLTLFAEADRDRIRIASDPPGSDVSSPDRYSIKVNTRHNGHRDAEVTDSAITWDGQTAHLTVLRDVTEQRALEAHYQQAQRMESVGRLAGGVAHDFNNLLTVLSGHAELALLKVRPQDPLRPDLEEILKTGERAANLTRQLLAFSRRQVISPRLLDLNATVLDMERMLHRLISEDVALITVRQPDLWKVEADPGQIEQVIVNLAVNARDAMPHGGKLTIATANVVLQDEKLRLHPDIAPGAYVLLTVSDTGIGMTPDVKAKAFEPFFTTKPVDVGTGLGLATVYGIVTQSGGHIALDSELGHGTTFRIYLPRVAGDLHRTTTAAHPATEAESGEVILVVEDDDAVREMTVDSLKWFSYQVLEARSGEEALALTQTLSEPVDLVLTDVVMPGMDGQQLAKRLRERWPHLKVLLMSGYTSETEVIGPNTPYLQKPVRPHVLAQKIRELLNEKVSV